MYKKMFTYANKTIYCKIYTFQKYMYSKNNYTHSFITILSQNSNYGKNGSYRVIKHKIQYTNELYYSNLLKMCNFR